MTIDASAIVAILLNEPERAAFMKSIDSASIRLASTATILEVTIVLEGRFGSAISVEIDEFLLRTGIETIAFDEKQLVLARSAFRRYGKGRHKAALNFGDCIAYALSQWTGEPLLYKGRDFAATDVRSALV